MFKSIRKVHKQPNMVITTQQEPFVVHQKNVAQQKEIAPLTLRDTIIAQIINLASPLSPLAIWREQELNVVYTGDDTMNGMFGSFASWEQQEAYLDAWVATASAEHLDILLDILVHPPDLEGYSERVREDWHYELERLLIGLARRDPATALPKLTALLDKVTPKTPIINAIGNVGSSESYRLFGKHKGWESSSDTSLIDQAITVLWSLHDEVNQFSDEELSGWIDGLCTIGGPTRSLVLQLYHELPAHKIEARNEIKLYLDLNAEEWKQVE